MIMSSLSKVWIFTVYALLGAPGSIGVDQPVVTVLAPEDHGPLLRTRLPEKKHISLLRVELEERFLQEHGFDGVRLAAHAPGPLGLSLRRKSQLLPLPALPTLLLPPFLPLFLEFLLQVFESHVQGVHQIMGFFHNDESRPLRLDMDLGLVAVFLHGEDEVDLDDRSQQLFERLEFFLTVGLDLGREVHLPSREMHDHELPSMANLLFRIWDGGILSCLRYLATVRRAILRLFLARMSSISISLKGLPLSSPSTSFLIFSLTFSEEISSPKSPTRDLWKKYLRGKTPQGVVMNLLATTRPTVDSWTPISRAISIRVSGLM